MATAAKSDWLRPLTHRDPWDCRGEKLPPVDLDELMLRVEAYGRPLHRVAAARRAMGLPVTDRSIELKLKNLLLWPAEAAPLPFDAADLLYMLPKKERVTVYGLLMGLAPKAIARQMGWTIDAVAYAKTSAWCRWIDLAKCLGLKPGSTNPEERLSSETVKKALGYNGPSYARELAQNLGVWHFGRREWVDGYIRQGDFFTVWSAAPRWEECTVWYIAETKTRVTDETYRMLYGQTPDERDDDE